MAGSSRNIYYVRLTRNAKTINPGNSSNIEQGSVCTTTNGKQNEGSSDRSLLAFDYFDQVRYISISELREAFPKVSPHIFFSGVRDPFEIIDDPNNSGGKTRGKRMYLSYLSLTLMEYPEYRYKDKEDPFVSVQGQTTYLSLISITQLPSENSGSHSLNDLDSLRKHVHKITQMFLNEKTYTVSAGLFFSVNSGELMVVLRSCKIGDAYKLSLMIRTSHTDLFSTFTVTAVDFWEKCKGTDLCGDEEGKNVEFSLRFSTKDPYMAECIYKQCKNANDKGNFWGLYGRYDITIDLSQRQFFELLPVLQAYKAKENISDVMNKSNIEDPVNKQLAAFFKDGSISTLNVRPLFRLIGTGPYAENPQGQKDDTYDILVKDILTQDAYLKKGIEALLEKANRLQFLSKEFSVNMNLLRDIRKTYAGVRTETDSLINGYHFFSLMNSFIRSIHTEIDKLEYSDKLENDIKQLIVWIYTVIVRINSFSKLVQSVNLQSIQSPNFEMQTRVDMEKYVLSYMEFLRKFASDYKGYDYDVCKKTLFPFFAVEMQIPANYSNSKDTEMTMDWMGLNVASIQGGNREQDGDHIILVPISVPTVNFFISIYRALPVVCHEASHFVKVVSREERNKKVMKILLEHIAIDLSTSWIASDRYGFQQEVEENIKKVFMTVYENHFFKYLEEKKKEEEIEQEKENAKGKKIVGYLGKPMIALPEYVSDFFSRCFPIKAASDPMSSFERRKNKMLRIAWDNKLSDKKTNEDVSFERVLNSSNYMKKKMFDAIKKYTEWDRKTALINWACIQKKWCAFVEEIFKLLVQRMERVFTDLCKGVASAINADEAEQEKLTKQLVQIHRLLPDNIKWEWQTDPLKVSYKRFKDDLSEKRDCMDKQLEEMAEPYVSDQKNDTRLLFASIKDFKENIGYVLEDFCAVFKRYREGNVDLGKIFRDENEYLKAVHSLMGVTKKEQGEKDSFSLLAEEFQHELKKIMNETKNNLDYRTLNDSFMELGVMDDGDNFAKRFAGLFQAFDGGQLGRVDEIVNETLDIYQEAFADLCMCAAMGFSPFGYLRYCVLNQIESSHDNVNNNEKGNTYYEKCAIVVYALLKTRIGECEDPVKRVESVRQEFNEIETSVNKFINDGLDKIEGEIADNETKERKDVIKKGIEDFKESLKDPIYVSGSANILWGILFSGDSACGEKSIPESERNRVFDHSHPNFIRDHLKSFERLQVIYNSLRTNVPEKCDRKIYEYLSEIFQKKIINKKVAGDKGELQQWNAMPGCKWERPDKTDMEIRKNISKFYNEWCFEEFNMDSAEERFRDCLKFCELHFYNSRERLKNRIPIVSDEEADVDDYNQMSERYSEWIIKQLSDPDCDRSPDPAGA